MGGWVDGLPVLGSALSTTISTKDMFSVCLVRCIRQGRERRQHLWQGYVPSPGGGGWVGGWVRSRRMEEKEAVRMRCWTLLGGGWVGRPRT